MKHGLECQRGFSLWSKSAAAISPAANEGGRVTPAAVVLKTLTEDHSTLLTDRRRPDE